MEPFKLGAEYNVYNNSKTNTPAQILLENSTTHEQIETQKESEKGQNPYKSTKVRNNQQKKDAFIYKKFFQTS